MEFATQQPCPKDFWGNYANYEIFFYQSVLKRDFNRCNKIGPAIISLVSLSLLKMLFIFVVRFNSLILPVQKTIRSFLSFPRYCNIPLNAMKPTSAT